MERLTKRTPYGATLKWLHNKEEALKVLCDLEDRLENGARFFTKQELVELVTKVLDFALEHDYDETLGEAKWLLNLKFFNKG